MLNRELPVAVALALALALAAGACSSGSDAGRNTGSDGRQRLLLGTTHTLEDSGLLDTLTAGFRTAHPEQPLQVIVAGSGEIIALARRGDLDVILTHAPADEASLVRDRYGVARHVVMRNQFTIAGPAADPAHVADAGSAVDALLRIRAARHPFISRGDGSGTHSRETALWTAAGVTPDWDRYGQAGAGMADVLRVASQRGAYTLTDIATFTMLRGELDLAPLLTRDEALLNEYSVVVMKNARNSEGAKLLQAWLLGAEAGSIIHGFGRDWEGKPLFSTSDQL